MNFFLIFKLLIVIEVSIFFDYVLLYSLCNLKQRLIAFSTCTSILMRALYQVVVSVVDGMDLLLSLSWKENQKHWIIKQCLEQSKYIIIWLYSDQLLLFTAHVLVNFFLDYNLEIELRFFFHFSKNLIEIRLKKK